MRGFLLPCAEHQKIAELKKLNKWQRVNQHIN
jgi:hypothetical protein